MYSSGTWGCFCPSVQNQPTKQALDVHLDSKAYMVCLCNIMVAMSCKHSKELAVSCKKQKEVNAMHLFFVYGVDATFAYGQKLLELALAQGIRVEEDELGIAIRKLNSWGQGDKLAKQAYDSLSKEEQAAMDKVVKLGKPIKEHPMANWSGLWVVTDHSKVAKEIRKCWLKSTPKPTKQIMQTVFGRYQ